MNIKCEECKHATFNDVWGEYKCDVHQCFVCDLIGDDCPYYEKKGEMIYDIRGGI